MDGGAAWEVEHRRRAAWWWGLVLAVALAIIVGIAITRTRPRIATSLVVGTAPSTPPAVEGVARWTPLERSTGTTLSLAFAGAGVHLFDVDGGEIVEECRST
ncbi:MAG: hypothetical protein KY460_16495 [Actinobacteria bacterium]|nr:hypothetical protein [Actinomycetota bacterium]